MDDIKAQLVAKIIQTLDERIRVTEAAIKSAEESKLNETKSSAGDKFETGRAMMQMEQDKLEMQLAKNIQLKKIVEQLPLDQKHINIQGGSLVRTNQLNYFVSIGMAKIKLESSDWYAISPVSPIGNLLLNKKAGDSFSFRNSTINILQVD